MRSRLRTQPQLASWMAAGHHDQVRLEDFLSDAEDLTQSRLEAITDPLALCLDVGLPPDTPLLHQHDLDNYLVPLVTRLGRRGERHFASVRCTNQHAEASYISITGATPLEGRQPSTGWLEIRTSASSQSTAFKQQICDQLQGAVELEEGAVALHLIFTVGPTRNWLNLWKPTIDALEPILGPSTPGRQWHPRDDRVVELGLRCLRDPGIGNDVTIAIDARTVA
jgi:hypothetical protein